MFIIEMNPLLVFWCYESVLKLKMARVRMRYAIKDNKDIE